MLAMLLGCGLRRSKLVGLETDEVQTRQDHWAIVDVALPSRISRHMTPARGIVNAGVLFETYHDSNISLRPRSR
jgi:site-specific recombinase XerD